MKRAIIKVVLYFFLSFTFTIIFLILLYDYIVKNFLIDSYISECRNLCEETIYEELEDYMSELNLDSCVEVSFDQNNKTYAYVTDDVELSNLKIDLINHLNNVINNLDTEKIEIKSGGLLNNAFFIGKGPTIKIGFNPSGSVTGVLTKQVESIEFNKTNYTVTANFNVNVTSKFLLYNIDIDVPIEYNLIDMIIIDELPEVFFSSE